MIDCTIVRCDISRTGLISDPGRLHLGGVTEEEVWTQLLEAVKPVSTDYVVCHSPLTDPLRLNSGPGRCPRQNTLSPKFDLAFAADDRRPVSCINTASSVASNRDQIQRRANFFLILDELGTIAISYSSEERQR